MGARNAERAKSSVKNGRALIIGTTLGVSGYYSGPQVYYIDKASLTDAFSVRLPVVKRWRIGHFTRIWPDGYVESRLNNLNLIKDPKLADLYDKILLITKGPLFDKERWKAIWEVNTGRAGKLQGG
jgi:arabinofuranosyltransferase